MKRILALLLCALTALALTTGCQKQPEAATAAYAKSDDIVTYRNLDLDKTTIVVSRTGNIYADHLNAAFEEANPDIQVIYIDITGGNMQSKPMTQWIEKGYAPDIMYIIPYSFSDEATETYFENLSAHPVIESYQTEALNRVAVSANIYWLPGPSQIECMLYNKTLFERYGWQVPNTFDEFVDLCVKIREDTNGEVEPWNPNAKYSKEIDTALGAFVYEELYGGVENRTWYNEFISGNETFAGHMEPYYEMVQTLADNGILREEHFSYSATTRGKEFEAGKIAMINSPIRLYENDEFEFGFMPFPTTKGELGYLCDNFCCVLGVPKKERTQAEKDAVDKYITFFSSEEGQRIFISNALMISNVKNVPLSQPEHLNSLGQAIENGHTFARLDFKSKSGEATFSMTGSLREMVNGETTGAECITAIDAQPYKPAAEPVTPPETVAKAEEDFTILEVSNYFADMYRETAGADIGLIVNNSAYRGNLMRIFKGDINVADVTVLKPRSFANDSALAKVSMTGKQIRDALDKPVGNGKTIDAVYAVSGLKCKVAPWNAPGEKMLSVTLADGKPLEEDTLYTVAIWQGTVYDEFITETLKTYEGSFEELLTAKLKADGSIKPVDDGRMELIWE